MALGKPDAGKPPVRFDEGRSQTVIGLVPLQPVGSAYSTQHYRELVRVTAADSFFGLLPAPDAPASAVRRCRAGRPEGTRAACGSNRQTGMRCLKPFSVTRFPILATLCLRWREEAGVKK